MIYYNTLIFSIFVGFLAVGYAYFLSTGGQRQQAIDAAAADEDDVAMAGQ